MPTAFVRGVVPQMVAGPNSEPFTLTNDGPGPLYIASYSSLSVQDYEFRMAIGQTLGWAGGRELWAITDPNETASAVWMIGAQNTFSPAPDNVTVAGAVTVLGTVTVAGSVSITGPVTVTGSVAISGPVTVTGAVTVSGTVSISGPVTVSGAVTVTGTVSISGPVTVSGSVSVTGTVAISGPVTVNGSVNVAGNINVTNSVLNIAGGVDVLQLTQVLYSNTAIAIPAYPVPFYTPTITTDDWTQLHFYLSDGAASSIETYLVEIQWFNTGGSTFTEWFSAYRQGGTEYVTTVKGDSFKVGIAREAAAGTFGTTKLFINGSTRQLTSTGDQYYFSKPIMTSLSTGFVGGTFSFDDASERGQFTFKGTFVGATCTVILPVMSGVWRVNWARILGAAGPKSLYLKAAPTLLSDEYLARNTIGTSGEFPPFDYYIARRPMFITLTGAAGDACIVTMSRKVEA